MKYFDFFPVAWVWCEKESEGAIEMNQWTKKTIFFQ